MTERNIYPTTEGNSSFLSTEISPHISSLVAKETAWFERVWHPTVIKFPQIRESIQTPYSTWWEAQDAPRELLNRLCGHTVVDTGFLIRGDVLDIVSRLPMEFGSFVLNGMDANALPLDSDYIQEFIAQISRATIPGGWIVGAGQMGLLDDFQMLPEFTTTFTVKSRRRFYAHQKQG